MTKAIQILSKNLTGKENILIKETNSQYIKILDSYLFSENIKKANFNKISSILTNRVSQIVLTNNNYEKILSNYGNFNWVIEIKFLPGVTDNIANTATEMIGENINSYKNNGIGTSLYLDLEQSLDQTIPLIACEFNLKPANEESRNFHKKLNYKNVGVQFTENNRKKQTESRRDCK